jgi:hypothetical protein
MREHMRTFFALTPFKAKMTSLLVLYIVLSFVFLYSMPTRRIERFSDIEILGTILTIPGQLLILPGYYISSRVLTLNQAPYYYPSPGPHFNKPIQRTTLLSYIAGFLCELFFLYMLACVYGPTPYFETPNLSTLRSAS